jgi:hypothetical protein
MHAMHVEPNPKKMLGIRMVQHEVDASNLDIGAFITLLLQIVCSW